MPESSTHQPIGAAHDARSRAYNAAPELQTLSRVFSENRSPLFGTHDDRTYRASPSAHKIMVLPDERDIAAPLRNRVSARGR